MRFIYLLIFSILLTIHLSQTKPCLCLSYAVYILHRWISRTHTNKKKHMGGFGDREWRVSGARDRVNKVRAEETCRVSWRPVLHISSQSRATNIYCTEISGGLSITWLSLMIRIALCGAIFMFIWPMSTHLPTILISSESGDDADHRCFSKNV